ncbi:hypothetical protein PLICRDRAFT_463200 [Plicaturopsis crispa FD-325 SS-3]|nr:hypothetical protein PLICRDRAFT_463200 [Plicaturopsis crispa FD-325 SS-3]
MAFILRYNPLLPLLFLSCLGTTLATFVYRLYDNDGCVHGGSDNNDTSPPKNENPLPGDPGNCYNAPLGSPAWNKLEIAWNGQAGNTARKATRIQASRQKPVRRIVTIAPKSTSTLSNGFNVPSLHLCSSFSCSIGSLYVQLFDI